MCSLLPSLLTAKRRLRLSSQYSRCKIASKTITCIASKLKAPLESGAPCPAWRLCVSQRGALYRQTKNFPQQLSSTKCILFTIFLKTRLCVIKAAIRAPLDLCLGNLGSNLARENPRFGKSFTHESNLFYVSDCRFLPLIPKRTTVFMFWFSNEDDRETRHHG